MNNDDLIVARLGERQRKISRINEFKTTKKKQSNFLKLVSYTGLSAVACIAILFVAMPRLFNHNRFDVINLAAPSFAEYRGSSSKTIEQAIQCGDFISALNLTDEAIAQCELTINEYHIKSNDNIEETNYMIAIEKEYLESLIWTRIYILVQLEDENGLITACNSYLKDTDYQLYRAEVEKILKIFE